MADSFAPELERVVNAAIPAAEALGNSCLNASRVLQEVLIKRGTRARVLASDVVVGNSIFSEDAIGFGRIPDLTECRPGAWTVRVEHDRGGVGHVVVFARGFLVDLTVRQFQRVDRGIETPSAFVARAPLGWMGGGELAKRIGATLFVYTARPDHHRFQMLPGFQLNDTNKICIESVLSRLAMEQANG